MNERFFKSVLLCILVSFSGTVFGQQTLTLEQAKQIAVQRNAGLAAIKERAEAARARQGRAESGFYPKVETKLGSEQGVGDEEQRASSFGYLAAIWNVYRGGQDVAAVKMAGLQAKRAQLEYDSERLAVENDVERVFSNLLFLRDVAKIKERFVQINSEQQKLAKQVVARGGGSQSDVVEFDLRSATLKSELAQIEQDYRGFLARLKVLLGDDVAKNPSPSGELPHQHLIGALPDYVNSRLAEAPEVKSAGLTLDIASHRSIATKGRWLPQVDVEGRFGALPSSEGGTRNSIGSSVLIVGTWELFGGFDATHEVSERSAEGNEADLLLKSDINLLLADVESRFGELVTIQLRADLEKDSIKTAKRYYDLVFDDFKRGYKNSGDFSAAAQTWYDVEVQRKRLDLEFVEKKLALELKLGKRIAANAMQDVDTPKGGSDVP